MAQRNPKPKAAPKADAKAAAPTVDPTWIRNDSPQGALDTPLLHRTVDAAEVVKVSRAHADILTKQSIWTEVPEPTPPSTEANSNGEQS